MKIKDPNAEFLSDEVYLEKRVYWGSRDYLLSKALHDKDPSTYCSYISPEADIFSCSKNNIKFFHKGNGNKVKIILDVIKIVYNGKELYGVVAENRPLLSLYKRVNHPRHSVCQSEFKWLRVCARDLIRLPVCQV